MKDNKKSRLYLTIDTDVKKKMTLISTALEIPLNELTEELYKYFIALRNEEGNYGQQINR